MADETRERIMDATMNLIMERGYSQTTTKKTSRQRPALTNVPSFANSKEKRISSWQL